MVAIVLSPESLVFKKFNIQCIRTLDAENLGVKNFMLFDFELSYRVLQAAVL